MSNSSSQTVNINGVLLTGMFLIFLTLKLTNYITWSWWWVTAPLWAPLAIIFLIMAFVALIFLITGVAKKRF